MAGEMWFAMLLMRLRDEEAEEEEAMMREETELGKCSPDVLLAVRGARRAGEGASECDRNSGVSGGLRPER